MLNKFAERKCPKATQDIETNTKNRNKTRENHQYGPLNPSKPSEEYWKKLQINGMQLSRKQCHQDVIIV